LLNISIDFSQIFFQIIFQMWIFFCECEPTRYWGGIHKWIRIHLFSMINLLETRLPEKGGIYQKMPLGPFLVKLSQISVHFHVKFYWWGKCENLTCFSPLHIATPTKSQRADVYWAQDYKTNIKQQLQYVRLQSTPTFPEATSNNKTA
jgi:hypothetical protein